MYGKIGHHVEEGRRMRILGTERTNKHFDATGSVRSQSREEGHPPKQELRNRKSSHVEEWKWRCHLGIWGCCVRCTQSLSKVCGFKRCFLKSISEVPVPHSLTETSVPETLIYLLSLTHLESANVGSLPPPSMALVLAPPWRSLLFWWLDTLFMGNNTELGTKC